MAEDINVSEVTDGMPEGYGPEGEDISLNAGVPAEGQEQEDEPEEEHLNTKALPAVVMLLGGAATAISCFVREYPLMRMLVVIFFSLLLFWLIGIGIKMLLDKIVIIRKEETEEDAGIENPESSDGAVIEKNAAQ